MQRTFLASLAFSAIALSSALPALAQHPNLSDITGPNVSDITGPNVSDITGPNASDITGTNISANTTARARRALRAGMDNDDLRALANDIRTAFGVCDGGGDCSTLVSLLEQSESILGAPGEN